jgi:hypothetical protein
MEKEDREILERMAKAQEQIAGLVAKPESKIVRALTIASLSAGVLGAGVFGIIQLFLGIFGG